MVSEPGSDEHGSTVRTTYPAQSCGGREHSFRGLDILLLPALEHLPGVRLQPIVNCQDVAPDPLSLLAWFRRAIRLESAEAPASRRRYPWQAEEEKEEAHLHALVLLLLPLRRRGRIAETVWASLPQEDTVEAAAAVSRRTHANSLCDDTAAAQLAARGYGGEVEHDLHPTPVQRPGRHLGIAFLSSLIASVVRKRRGEWGGKERG